MNTQIHTHIKETKFIYTTQNVYLHRLENTIYDVNHFCIIYRSQIAGHTHDSKYHTYWKYKYIYL